MGILYPYNPSFYHQTDVKQWEYCTRTIPLFTTKPMSNNWNIVSVQSLFLPPNRCQTMGILYPYNPSFYHQTNVKQCQTMGILYLHNPSFYHQTDVKQWEYCICTIPLFTTKPMSNNGNIVPVQSLFLPPNRCQTMGILYPYNHSFYHQTDVKQWEYCTRTIPLFTTKPMSNNVNIVPVQSLFLPPNRCQSMGILYPYNPSFYHQTDVKQWEYCTRTITLFTTKPMSNNGNIVPVQSLFLPPNQCQTMSNNGNIVPVQSLFLPSNRCQTMGILYLYNHSFYHQTDVKQWEYCIRTIPLFTTKPMSNNGNIVPIQSLFLPPNRCQTMGILYLYNHSFYHQTDVKQWEYCIRTIPLFTTKPMSNNGNIVPVQSLFLPPNRCQTMGILYPYNPSFYHQTDVNQWEYCIRTIPLFTTKPMSNNGNIVPVQSLFLPPNRCQTMGILYPYNPSFYHQTDVKQWEYCTRTIPLFTTKPMSNNGNIVSVQSLFLPPNRCQTMGILYPYNPSFYHQTDVKQCEYCTSTIPLFTTKPMSNNGNIVSVQSLFLPPNRCQTMGILYPYNSSFYHQTDVKQWEYCTRTIPLFTTKPMSNNGNIVSVQSLFLPPNRCQAMGILYPYNPSFYHQTDVKQCQTMGILYPYNPSFYH